MAHHKPAHPYHLVNPSPWPLVMSFSALALVSGGVMYMHKIAHGPLVMAGGLLGVLAVMFLWWRDVVREGMRDKAHTVMVRKGLRFGMALFIVSEVMFFFAFFWSFFNASLHPLLPLVDVWEMGPGVWPPKGIHPLDAWDIPLINTMILLLSGTTVTWAHHALLENNRKGLITGLAITVVLGVLFSCLQAYEYAHASFKFKDGVYASTFYMATGFHGFHVIVGTIFLTVCLVRAIRNQFTTEGHLGFEFAAWYWHFVDVVWLFLFVSVYWWGAGDALPAAH
jgi:cytochrome c oxidase subunit 3